MNIERWLFKRDPRLISKFSEGLYNVSSYAAFGYEIKAVQCGKISHQFCMNQLLITINLIIFFYHFIYYRNVSINFKSVAKIPKSKLKESKFIYRMSSILVFSCDKINWEGISRILYSSSCICTKNYNNSYSEKKR